MPKTAIKFEKSSFVTIGDTDYLMLALPKDYENTIKSKKFVGEAPDKMHVAILEPHKEKRSLDANAKFWVLCGQLSSVIGVPTNEIYRDYIKNIGDNFEVIEVRDDAKARWIEVWSDRGIGWACEDLGTAENEGYSQLLCYFGSSTYNARQMHNLLDLLIFDCKEQGIETLSPDELHQLINRWEDKRG